MTALLRRAGLALFGSVALLAVFVPREAHAYCRTTTTPVPASYNPTGGCFTQGLPLFWRGKCVGYSVNGAASALVPFDEATRVIDAAFSTWNDAVCADSGDKVGIVTSNFGSVTCSEVRYNQNGPNQNVIVFRDDVWPYSDPNNTLGLTTVTFNADTGEIYDADMEINASGKNLSTAETVPANGFDLLSVITHEAGHFLGLAHAMNASSTMYASYRAGTSALRSLTPDDVAGVCSIYPTSEQRNVDPSVEGLGVAASTACDPAPRHGFSTECEANAAPIASADDASSSGCAASGTGHVPPGSAAMGLAMVGLALAARARRPRR
ncbi:MAG: hypothetical protein JWP97_3848 [Labilithrix sp.]|nr:hypothetical protein [Labilithrix sp.]